MTLLSLNPKAHLDIFASTISHRFNHLALHSLGHHRIEKEKPIPKDPSSSTTAAWAKPSPSGTLESVVDQATHAQLLPPAPSLEFATWLRLGLEPHCSSPPVMDALVPCATAQCDDAADPGFGRKRARVREAGLVCASQGSAAAPAAGRGGESTLVMLDTCGGDDVGFTTTNNTNSPTPTPTPTPPCRLGRRGRTVGRRRWRTQASATAAMAAGMEEGGGRWLLTTWTLCASAGCLALSPSPFLLLL